MFHPFSQENPLQTGTGLGLAIVNSIVRSSSVDGKVDVWSSEGVGTEIKVTFTAELVRDEELSQEDSELLKVYGALSRPPITMNGFDDSHRGTQLLRNVLSSYLVNRWGFVLAQGAEPGDIVVVNEDFSQVLRATEEKSTKRAFIILSSARGNARLMGVVSDYERLGGFCRILYKPFGPQRLYSSLKLCLHALNIARFSRNKSGDDAKYHPSEHLTQSGSSTEDLTHYSGSLPRRYSEDKNILTLRPPLGPRSFTAHPLSSWADLNSTTEQEETGPPFRQDSPVFAQSPSSPTISIGNGGTLLKSSVGTLKPKRSIRVLVVEDNAILRNLLYVLSFIFYLLYLVISKREVVSNGSRIR